MALQNKTTQVSAGHSQTIDEALSALIADLELMPIIAEGCIGATPRELAARQGLSEGYAQRLLRAKVEKGYYDCGLGWRYSPILKRDYKAVVYWIKERTKE